MVRTSPRRERVIRTIAALSYLYSLYWIVWRWSDTINWTHPVFSIVLLVAETFGLLSTTFFLFTVWRLAHRTPPPAKPGRTVDVFITCYDEPLQILRRTVLGARAITYPHGTYLLDDGKRDEVRALAADLGVGYIRRVGNDHAKAGNLNHAMGVTTAELVLQLDADHVPLPHILDRLVGYFDDEAVAFVQSPQEFYNMDSFTHVVNSSAGDRKIWEENRLFFSLIQPGKDRFNASFFCGSCGVLRRSAFAAMGGFSTETITEDMESSMLLHARGWKSLYHEETLAYGLAPASAAQYHVQRLRWGQGSMQILRKMNPLFVPGLTWQQKIGYFSSVIVYIDGIQRLIFYVAPILFFLFGVLPVSVDNHALMVRLLPFLALTIGSFELMSRGTGYILTAERYNMTRFWTYVMATYGFFTTKKLKFNVTPKGAGDVPFGTYAPQAILAGLSVGSMLWALFARHIGLIDYHDGGGVSTAFIVNGIWIAWNTYFALAVVRHSIKSRQLREDYRFVQRLPVLVQPDALPAVPATTEDINIAGLSFRSATPVAEGSHVTVPLKLNGQIVSLEGTVTRQTPADANGVPVFSHGVRFESVPLDVQDAIELSNVHHAVPVQGRLHEHNVPLVDAFARSFMNPRRATRRAVSLPAQVWAGAREAEVSHGVAFLDEVSRDGVRLLLDEPLAPGTPVRWAVEGTHFEGTGTVVFARCLTTSAGSVYVAGVRRDVSLPGRFALARSIFRSKSLTPTPVLPS